MPLKNKEVIISFLNNKFPNPKTVLNYKNGYELIIAVVLSAQAQDIVVNKVTPMLFLKYPNFVALSKANEKDVSSIIKIVGLANTKARNIIKLANQIIKNFNGKIPNNKKDLLKLSGVGGKTANVILAVLFKKNVMPVDTHIARFAKRLNIADENDNVNIIEKKLTKYFQGEKLRILHHQIIYFGRTICKAQSPNCSSCLFSDFCKYYQQNKK